jgi:hypothetical protein
MMEAMLKEYNIPNCSKNVLQSLPTLGVNVKIFSKEHLLGLWGPFGLALLPLAP